MKKVFDICIIGSGISGTFAALRISEKYNNVNSLIIDVGKPPMKRRRQLEGFLGCFPTGDGKIYPGDLDKIRNISDGRKINPAYKWVTSILSEVNTMKLVKTSKPNINIKNKILDLGFDVSYHDYFQWKPKSVHELSKFISEKIEDNKNIQFSFDNFVYSVRKNNLDLFQISTEEGDFFAKKVILCVGRSGWRWVTNLYDDLGIISCDDYAEYGVRVEVSGSLMTSFNKSHMSMKKDNLFIGPLSWNGTVIQEDHSDLVISSFRSNEERWKSDKVSFSLLSSVFYKDQGSVQADRIGKLAFLLFNDRVSKEKIRLFMKNKSQLNLIPEFKWLKEGFEKLEELIPDVIKKGYFHIPEINPKAAEIKIGSNLETEIDNMFVAGEAAGVKGIMAAAVMGVMAADSACK